MARNVTGISHDVFQCPAVSLLIGDVAITSVIILCFAVVIVFTLWHISITIVQLVLQSLERRPYLAELHEGIAIEIDVPLPALVSLGSGDHRIEEQRLGIHGIDAIRSIVVVFPGIGRHSLCHDKVDASSISVVVDNV